VSLKVWAVLDEFERALAIFERESDALLAVSCGFGDDVMGYTLLPAGFRLQEVRVYHSRATARVRGRLKDAGVTSASSMEFDIDDPAPIEPRLEESGTPGVCINLRAVCATPAPAEKAVRDRLAEIYAEWGAP